MLRGLRKRKPPLVEADVDGLLGQRVWHATAAGAAAVDELDDA